MTKYLFKLLIVAMVLASCKSEPSVWRVDPMEKFGTKGKPFEGLMFQTYYQGGIWTSPDEVKYIVTKIAAQKAYDMGYKFFTVLQWNADEQFFASTEANLYGWKYSYKPLFVVLPDDMLEGWNNIYRVSRYIDVAKLDEEKKQKGNK